MLNKVSNLSKSASIAFFIFICGTLDITNFNMKSQSELLADRGPSTHDKGPIIHD